jgi:hypothetical protein
MTLIAMCISAVQSERPAYPSSKSRTKDWDKLEAEVKKEVLQLCPVYVYLFRGSWRVGFRSNYDFGPPYFIKAPLDHYSSE